MLPGLVGGQEHSRNMFGYPIQRVTIYEKALIGSFKMSVPLLPAPVPTVRHIK